MKIIRFLRGTQPDYWTAQERNMRYGGLEYLIEVEVDGQHFAARQILDDVRCMTNFKGFEDHLVESLWKEIGSAITHHIRTKGL